MNDTVELDVFEITLGSDLNKEIPSEGFDVKVSNSALLPV
jgi:hypothetical protein